MIILNTNEASCHFCVGFFFGRKVFSALQPCPQHRCVRRWGQRCASCLHSRSVRAQLIPVPAELPCSGAVPCPGGSALSRGQSPALAEELLPEELEVSEEQQEGLRVRGPSCQPCSGARLSPLPRRCLFATGQWATARGTPCSVGLLPHEHPSLQHPGRDLLRPAAPPSCFVAFHCHSGGNAAS